MRFMMLMIPKNGYESTQGSTPTDREAVARMLKYNESLQKAGVLLALDGLQSPAKGARVTFTGGAPVVQDGPFAEAKEVLGGYWLIDVKSRAEAIEWAKRCPGGPDGMIEVRQCVQREDWPAEMHDTLDGGSVKMGLQK